MNLCFESKCQGLIVKGQCHSEFGVLKCKRCNFSNKYIFLCSLVIDIILLHIVSPSPNDRSCCGVISVGKLSDSLPCVCKGLVPGFLFATQINEIFCCSRKYIFVGVPTLKVRNVAV